MILDPVWLVLMISLYSFQKKLLQKVKNFAKEKDNIKNIVLDCKAVKNSQETSMLVPLTNEKLNLTLNINNLPLIGNNLLNEMVNKPILSGSEKTVLSTINQSANCYTTDKLNKNKNLTKTKKKIIKKDFILDEILKKLNILMSKNDFFPTLNKLKNIQDLCITYH